MSINWRDDDRLRQAAALRSRLAAVDLEIAERERDLQIAQDAEDERHADVRKLEAERFELRKIPPITVMVDKFEEIRPTPEAEREYARLTEAIQAREREHQQWVDARRITYQDGPRTVSWSPRQPLAVTRRLQFLRRQRPMIASALEEVERQLSPGQLVQSGVPAPDLVEHQQRVAAGRERAGVPA